MELTVISERLLWQLSYCLQCLSHHVGELITIDGQEDPKNEVSEVSKEEERELTGLERKRLLPSSSALRRLSQLG